MLAFLSFPLTPQRHSGISVGYCQWREMGNSSSFHQNVSASKKQSLRGVSFFLNIAPSPTEINSHSPQLGEIKYTPNKCRNWKRQGACSVSYINSGHLHQPHEKLIFVLRSTSSTYIFQYFLVSHNIGAWLKILALIAKFLMDSVAFYPLFYLLTKSHLMQEFSFFFCNGIDFLSFFAVMGWIAGGAVWKNCQDF